MVDIVKRIEELMDVFDEGEVTTANKIQRPSDPFREFEERNPMSDGGRVKYKVITELTEGDKINFKYPKDHKYKVQVPVKKDINQLGSLRTFSAKTKKELQDIVDKAPITNRDYTEGLVKTKLSEGAREFDKNRVKIPTDQFVGEGKERSRIFKIQNKDGTNVR